MIPLKKKQQDKKFSDYINLTYREILAHVLNRRLKHKIELIGDQLGFRKGREAKDAIGMIGIIIVL